MSRIRALLMQHRALALLVVMAALCMKFVVPTGFMIGQDSRVLTVEVCEDAFGNHMAKQIIIPMKDGGSDSHSKQDKAECPFASLSMASMTGADPALLALAIAFILALGFAATPIFRTRPVFHLRPPLRGPPALI